MSTDPRSGASGRRPLHERLGAIAARMSESGSLYGGTDVQVAAELAELAATLNGLAVALQALARECEEEYVHAHADGEIPTPAQGFMLARLLRRGLLGEPAEQRHARVTLSGAGRSGEYIHVRLSDGYEAGIDREGRVSR